MGNDLYDRALKGERRKRAEPLIADPKIVGALNRAFATEDGMRALHFIMDKCGWLDSTIGQRADAELADRATLYLSARREIYRELRSMIDHEILKQVEFYSEPRPETKGE